MSTGLLGIGRGLFGIRGAPFGTYWSRTWAFKTRQSKASLLHSTLLLCARKYPGARLGVEPCHYYLGFVVSSFFPIICQVITLTLTLLMSYRAPCKARNFNVVYIYGPTFGNAESRLFLFAAQCFNIESMEKVFLCHSCV
jgi:hypothetical protein